MTLLVLLDGKQKKKDTGQTKKDKQHLWKNYRFQVEQIQGHNDLIGCVALDGDILVSARSVVMVT